MEGSLKLKEVSYIHSEAYASGELKHGPLALITEHTPVVAVGNTETAFVQGSLKYPGSAFARSGCGAVRERTADAGGGRGISYL